MDVQYSLFDDEGADAYGAVEGARVADDAAREELCTELERALLRELVHTWQALSDTHFRGLLERPFIELTAARRTLGRWHRERRTIELSRPLIVSSPWGVVVEVLKHEMAHQYVHEALRIVDEAPHGEAFRSVCARLGIDAAAAGVPTSSDEAVGESRIVARITRLLALATSPNQHEAEAAAAAAQRLMLKYNIEHVREITEKSYLFRHLGEPTGRVTEAERTLAQLLGKHYFVDVIWVPVYRPVEGKRGSVLEVCGTAENLAVAEYVHGFLTRTAVELWRAHCQAHALRSNRDRRTFQAGVMAGFSAKLAEQAKESREAGLVWVKDGKLGLFLRQRHPHIRHVRHAGSRRNEAYAHGREAGGRIVIHRGVAASTNERGRLLPAKKG